MSAEPLGHRRPQRFRRRGEASETSADRLSLPPIGHLRGVARSTEPFDEADEADVIEQTVVVADDDDDEDAYPHDSE